MLRAACQVPQWPPSCGSATRWTRDASNQRSVAILRTPSQVLLEAGARNIVAESSFGLGTVSGVKPLKGSHLFGPEVEPLGIGRPAAQQTEFLGEGVEPGPWFVLV
jgi:hypothetical protein